MTVWNSAERAAHRAGDLAGRVPDGEDVGRRALVLGRAGIAAQGVLYLVLAWITGQVALGGSGGGQASSSGALSQVAEQPFGTFLLVLLALGFVAYVVWQALEAAGSGLGSRRTTARLKAAGKAVLGSALLAATISVLRGGGSGGSSGEQQATSTVLSWPAGQVLVVVAGAAVLGFAGYLVARGVRGTIREKLVAGVPRWLVRLGRVGDVGRGLALAAVGVLLVIAGFQGDAGQSRGLDGALRQLRDQPVGPVLVGGIAIGFAAWGAFCVLAARRHRRG